MPGSHFHTILPAAVSGVSWSVLVSMGAVEKVTVMTPPAKFQGSVRNGVTTHDFGRFGTAYKVETI